MNVLVIGSGGREHAFVHKIAQSTKLGKLYAAPGNAGTAGSATNLPLKSVTDFAEIAQICQEKSIQMLVVGPEAPLVSGISDYFSEKEDLSHIIVVGPCQKGANLEGSKHFSKLFMHRNKIPTAKAATFNQATLAAGLDYLATQTLPYVLKADGLAAGKGVIITADLGEAQKALQEMLGGKFGDAGKQVLIEEYLEGKELSVFVLTDGENYLRLPVAKDYKRIGEQDQGLNTGGMGAVSPVPFASEAFLKKVEQSIIEPTIEGLKKEGITYKGFLYFGLMKVGDEPYVIEYNVRMGDPETQAVLPRLQNDLLALFELMGAQRLDEAKIRIDRCATATVVLASGGYPQHYEKGKEITCKKAETPQNAADTLIFHAGTKEENGKIYTNGGRVLSVTGRGDTHKKALQNAYKRLEEVYFEQCYFRKDIGFDLS